MVCWYFLLIFATELYIHSMDINLFKLFFHTYDLGKQTINKTQKIDSKLIQKIVWKKRATLYKYTYNDCYSRNQSNLSHFFDCGSISILDQYIFPRIICRMQHRLVCVCVCQPCEPTTYCTSWGICCSLPILFWMTLLDH